MDLVTTLKPLALYLPLLAVGLLLAVRGGVGWSSDPRVMRAFSIGGMVTLLVVVVGYCGTPGVMELVEGSVAAISAAWWNGQPIHHPIDAPERYSLLYGPLVFVINGLFQQLVPDPLLAGKLLGTSSTLLGLALVWRSLPGEASGAKVVAVSALALAVVTFNHYPLAGRGDAQLFLLAAIGTYAAQRLRSPLRRLLVLALLVGASVHIKAHGPLYLVPLLAPLAFERNRAVSAMIFVVASAVFAILIFLCIPRASFVDYVGWLSAASGHGLDWQQFVNTASWAAIFFAPLIVLSRGIGGTWARRSGALALLASAAIVTVIASKAGAGRHHLLPLLPSLCALTHDAWRTSKPSLRAVGVSLASLTLVSLIGVGDWIGEAQRMSARSRGPVERELVAMARSAPQPVAVGYAEPSDYTLFRAHVVELGGPYLFDLAAVMDMRRSGLPNGDTSTGLLSEGRVASWLVPKESAPFEVTDYYQLDRETFSPAFRAAFLAHYRRAERGEYFDLWVYTD